MIVYQIANLLIFIAVAVAITAAATLPSGHSGELTLRSLLLKGAVVIFLGWCLIVGLMHSLHDLLHFLVSIARSLHL